MTFRSIIDDIGEPAYTLSVVGTDVPGPLESMLEETFEHQTVRVDSAIDESLESEVTTPDEDTVLLHEHDRLVATSPLASVYDALLAINSDLFVTGARGLGEIELPAVLEQLADSRFTLRGYPLAHKEKLLLILVSRYIEQLAWDGDSGTLRSAFQNLSRIDDEIGTRDVYQQLGDGGVDVHAYGFGDGIPNDLSIAVHTGRSNAYRDAWFVVYRPTEPDGEAAALLCLETEPRIWDGFWTFDEALVERVDDCVVNVL